MARAREPEERAPKSLYRPENQVFLATLRTFRQRQELTQVELADRLGRSQNYVTSAERGVIRLDGLQLRDWCHACGVDLVDWASEIEKQLSPTKRAIRKATRSPT
ncbi:MAG: helix-turn-helix domain-containing protein [Rhodanobacter sp.]